MYPHRHPRRGSRAALALAASLALAACGDPSEVAPERPPAWFREATAEMDLAYRCETGPIDDLALPRSMGGGVALFDAEGDGDLDLYLVNGSEELAGGGEATNHLFRREQDGSYTDVSANSGLADAGYGMGVAVGDVDNDGDEDLYVTNFGPDRLYLNHGDGTFEAANEGALSACAGWSCSAVFLDYDRDGWLDLYVTVYVEFDAEKPCSDRFGGRDFCAPRSFNPSRDVLLHNRGDGTFEDASESSGVASKAAAGLGVVCDDYDEDGWIDVYVTNDGYANYLWRNQGDGTFEDVAIQRGTALNLHGMPEAGMGVVSEDLDGDGDVDLFMTHLRNETNTLYRNRGGKRGFQDATNLVGLAAESVPFTGFGTAALDVELDGDLDIAVVNGRVQSAEVLDGAALEGRWATYCEPNQLFLGDGEGRFAVAQDAGDEFTAPVEMSRGLVAGDLDEDGDLDLVVTNLNGPARLYYNEAPRAGAWLEVSALMGEPRRHALGARVVVVTARGRVARTVRRSSGYLSSGPARAHFGLGPCEQVERIEVTWPDGSREEFPGGAVDRRVEVLRGAGAAL